MSVYNTIYDFSYYICIHYKTCFSFICQKRKDCYNSARTFSGADYSG